MAASVALSRASVVVAVLLAALVAGYPPSGSAAEPAVTVTPADVGMGLLYQGATLQVHGRIPAGADAVLLCVGADGKLVLKHKGKVWGLLWMNTGEVVFERVPTVYLLQTSTDLASLAPPEALVRLGIGYPALEERAMAGGGEDSGWFPELVRLKERERVFGVAEGVLRPEPQQYGRAVVDSTFFLPARVPAATYDVRLYSFRDQAGVLVGSATATLRQVGTTSFVASMARRRGLLYGIVAVLVAMAAGLFTGLVFGLGGKGGH